MCWLRRSNTCHVTQLGRTERKKKVEDPEIADLSNKQKKLKDDIEACRSKKQRENLKVQRNRILSKIHQRVQKKDTEKIIERIEEIENHKEDSNRMFQVVRQLQSKDKNKILVNAESGVTASEKKQVEIVTDYFREVFRKDSEKEVEDVKPVEMRKPFTTEEISKAVKKLKNNKSSGIYDISAEMIKYGPEVIHSRIAEIFNNMAKTGEVPEEIIMGILVPLPKPGKPRGPPANLRPVVLLTILRKILAICMIGRSSEKIQRKIPISQAAYQGGRNTTEHVFACKLLAEKAVTSVDYETTILLLDMSKAFDTVQRNTLLQQLKSILDDDEIHIMKIILKDVKLVVRMGKYRGEEINTNIGVPQGDCLSPILFTLYLAQALGNGEPSVVTRDHSYARPLHTTAAEEHLPDSLKDHTYASRDRSLLIDQQYADDTGWIGVNAGQKIERVKKEVPDKLKKSNLFVNEGKTEEYHITRGGDESWKHCKYLGSNLGTEEDIQRRKALAISTYNKMKHIIENKKTSTITIRRIFKTYIESVLLYNSELWSMNRKLEDDIDVFQRNQIRRALKIDWQDKITNNDLYKKIGLKPVSKVIRERRMMRWFGHMNRLPEEAPVKIAYKEALRPTKKPRGDQKQTWPKLMEKDLKVVNMTLDFANEYAHDRPKWRTLTHCAMSELSDVRRS